MNERYARPERFDAGGYYDRGERIHDDRGDRFRDEHRGYGRESMRGRDYSRTGQRGRPRYEQDDEGRYDMEDRGYESPNDSRREPVGDYGRSDFNRGYNRGDDYDRTPDYDRDRDPGMRERGAYGPAGNYSRSGYGRNEFEYDADYGRGYGAPMHGRRAAFETGTERGYGDRGYGAGDMGMRAGSAFAVPGPHSGTGPQGYERGKDRIREDVCERLTQHGQIDASEIKVDVDDDEVTLDGTVDSRRTKRTAEDVAESVMGVRDVHNRLRIRREDDGANRGGSSKGQRGKKSGEEASS